jgi:hypothetical protein
VEFCFARSLKFITDARILLHQYVIAAGSADAALYGHLTFGILRVAGSAILRQKKSAGKQQSKQ